MSLGHMCFTNMTLTPVNQAKLRNCTRFLNLHMHQAFHCANRKSMHVSAGAFCWPGDFFLFLDLYLQHHSFYS